MEFWPGVCIPMTPLESVNSSGTLISINEQLCTPLHQLVTCSSFPLEKSSRRHCSPVNCNIRLLLSVKQRGIFQPYSTWGIIWVFLDWLILFPPGGGTLCPPPPPDFWKVWKIGTRWRPGFLPLLATSSCTTSLKKMGAIAYVEFFYRIFVGGCRRK